MRADSGSRKSRASARAPAALAVLKLAVLMPLALIAALFLADCQAYRNWAAKQPPFRTVRSGVAFTMLRDSPELAILDLRTREEYGGPLGHLNRARNIPLAELPARIAELGETERPLLVYCRNDGCGEEGMRILSERGYSYAVLLEGGIERWITDGFHVVGSRQPELQVSDPTQVTPPPPQQPEGDSTPPPAPDAVPGDSSPPPPPPPAGSEPAADTSPPPPPAAGSEPGADSPPPVGRSGPLAARPGIG